MSRGALSYLLKNQTYRGMIAFKGELYPAEHEAIVEESLFNDVQQLLALMGPGEEARTKHGSPALLKGLLFDPAGERLLPTHCSKGKTKYRYYVSKALLKEGIKIGGFRIPAADIETIVINKLTAKLQDENWVTGILRNTSDVPRFLANAKNLANDLGQQHLKNTGLLSKLLTKIVFDKQSLRLIVSEFALQDIMRGPDSENQAPIPNDEQHDHQRLLEIIIPSHLLRCGKQMRLIIGNTSTHKEPDQRLVHEVLRARRWFKSLSSGAIPTIAALAKAEACSAPYISGKISLAFLAPDIFEAILDGTQPHTLTPERLKQACPLPRDWNDQRALLLA